MIPFVVSMGRSVYIDRYEMSFKLGGLIPLGFEDLLFVLVLIVYFLINQKRKIRFKFFKGTDIYLFIALGLLILFNLISAITQGENLLQSLGIAMPLPYLPICFFLWLNMLKVFSNDEILNLFDNIVIITVATNVLYIINAFGFGIYPYDVNMIEKMYNVNIIRDFSTYPIWSAMSLCYILSKKSKSRKDFIMIAILLIGGFFTYTRSHLLAFFLLILISFILAKNIKIPKQVFYISLILIMIYVTSFVLENYFSAYFDFFLGRASEMQSKGITGAGNSKVRIDLFISIANDLGSDNFLTGYGFIKYLAKMKMGNAILGDILWANVIFLLGFIGVFITVTIFLTNLVNSIKNYFKNKNTSHFSLMIFLFMVYTIIHSFASGDFIVTTAISSFPYALLSLEIRQVFKNIDAY